MDIAEQLAMVALVLILLCGTLWVMRSRGLVFKFSGGAGSGGRRLEVIERLPLTPSHSLHLVRVADRTLLIAVAPSGCSILDTSKDQPFSTSFESSLAGPR